MTRLADQAGRAAQAHDKAGLHDRYAHLLGWAATYTRLQATRSEAAVRRAYRRGASKPAWKQARRDRHADAASDALIAALFYGWCADRLEEDPKRATATIGHRFTLKELAELEDKARQEAPANLDRILNRRPR